LADVYKQTELEFPHLHKALNVGGKQSETLYISEMEKNKLPFFLLILVTNFSSIFCFAQSDKIKKTENKLLSIYSKIINNSDSTDFYSSLFEDELTKLIKNNPTTLDYSFKSLIDSKCCYIKTSKDKNFRIYSWDSWTGGTMHFFREIYQYRNNSKIYSKVLEYEEGDAGAYCSNIFTVSIDKQKYYLPITNGKYSNQDASQSISAFKISDNNLIDTTKLFKTKTKFLNRIDVEFNFFSVVDRSERPLELIAFDEEKMIIYIPVVNDKNHVTDRNILYQLKDKYFVFIGIEKGKRK
jgi:hypothetical protein